MITKPYEDHIIDLYNDFKETDEYKYRAKQTGFIPFARNLINLLVSKPTITNIDLTALIQIFKAGSGNPMAEKYIPLIFTDKKVSDNLIDAFHRLEYKGFTGAGKNSIGKLNDGQLAAVKLFLAKAFTIVNVDDAVMLCDEFDSLNIPEVKKGVYSPWLYYINPELFPIINTQHYPFLDWLQISKQQYSKSIILFNELKSTLNVNDLGLLDMFVYEMEFDDVQEDNMSELSIDVQVIYAYLVLSQSHRKIEDKILEIDSPARGGGFKVMEILHRFDIGGEKKGILKRRTIEEEKIEASDNYKDALNLLQKYYPNYKDSIIANKNIKPVPMSLNTILYGPPGTGKTYNTINKAVEIANPDFLANNREELKSEYQRLRDEGQIVFTTFHQSLGYEDFIEGIKPVLLQLEDDAEGVEAILPGAAQLLTNTINYKIEPGIFFTLCERARYKPDVQIKRFHISEDQFKKAQFFKISLGNTLRAEDDEIYDYCIKNDCIALGWGGANDFSNLSESETKTTAKSKGESDFATSSISKFIHYVKKGNYVLISKGNNICRAIGRVTGDYYFKQTDEIDYWQFRNVEWLIKDVAIPVSEIYNKSFSQQSIYKLDHQKLKLEFFVKSEEEIKSEIAAEPKNYVMIIDEINRGNVSQIFGELITLIEDDKREGCPEALDVTLPYSKKRFSVPPNLHIVGTMNTADRSVEALDTALRRRFSFIEMLPQEDNLGIKDFKGISLKNVLKNINIRLETLLSRDHLIGHSFFLNIDSLNKLYDAFFNKIIPQLQEYFFGDYGKIGLVLGKGFITSVADVVAFADFEYDDKDLLLEKKVYRIIRFTNDDHLIDEDKFIAAVKAIVG